MASPRPAGPRWRPGVRSVLSAMIIFTGVATALLVHSVWTFTSGRNLREVVTQLNRQIVTSVRHDLADLLAGAEAAREALRTIFFQGVIEARDEARREFIFLSLLQSNPSFSWVVLGFPNGDFFGAQKASDSEIRMVEVRPPENGDGLEMRVDRYRIVTDDIEFRERLVEPHGYRATGQPWFATAFAAGRPVWTEVSDFPTRTRPAIATATRLVVYQEFVGVIAIAIELERISRFLEGLTVGKTGAAYILSSDGRVIASSQASGTAADNLPEREMPSWRRLAEAGAGDEPMLSVTLNALRRQRILLEAIDDTTEIEYRQPGSDATYFVTLTPLPFEGWTIATVIPAEDFLGDVAENTRRLVWALIFFVIVVAAGGTLLGNLVIVNPIRRIIGQLRHVEKFMLERIERVPSPLAELERLSGGLVQMGQGLASFQKFLPTELVRVLVAQGVAARPGGERRELTVMFTDLVGFTSLSERLGHDIVPLLAGYLGRMSEVVEKEGGTVDKFIGDAVMAFWGAPLSMQDHALAACRAALAGQRLLASMRREATRTGAPELHMRIGLNTGRMLVGNIGSEARLNYTVIGDPVNLASRLEALNKLYGTAILIGPETRRQAGDAIIVRHVDRVAVYGRDEPVDVFELLGMAGETDGLMPLGWVRAYEEGLALYFAADWAGATRAFAEADRLRGGDPAAQAMLARIRARPNPASEDGWSGVEVLVEK
ncbi:MAG: adenylate/guanylate cyclase domain-containing protein [Alphaproteobacteria bacterium]|nr:adenylate/guanylate cyclase domain-containing protein [Alphaproteobacteria bacterium]